MTLEIELEEDYKECEVLEYELCPEYIYENLSPEEELEMADLLDIKLDIETDNLEHKQIKDFVYQLKFSKPELFKTLAEEVQYYGAK